MPIEKGPSDSGATPVSKKGEEEAWAIERAKHKDGRNADKMLNDAPKVTTGDSPQK